jgi:hypothetical protein
MEPIQKNTKDGWKKGLLSLTHQVLIFAAILEDLRPRAHSFPF